MSQKFFVIIILFVLLYQPTEILASTISPLRIITSGSIEKYAKFEVGFDISGSTSTNPYYPYDSSPHQTWTTYWQNAAVGGITVNMLLLAPGQTDWTNAKINPCFYYQPTEQVGSGSTIALLPVGKPEWRCRFSPDNTGTWQYKIRVIDSGGSSESGVQQFTSITPAPSSPTRHGFIRVSQTDKRFFEYSDGTPFVTPLVTTRLGSDIYSIRSHAQNLGTNGIHFIRWFPTEEDGSIVPFAGDIKSSWGFGPTWWKVDDTDSSSGNLFSFSPYYFTNQNVALKSGAKYKLSFRANITGERAILPEIQNISSNSQYLCSGTNTLFSSCQSTKDGWNSYEVTFTNSSNLSQTTVWIHSLFTNTDAPSPYNTVRTGTIRISNLSLQRDETGSGGWGSNLLAKGDPDTYRYIDQVEAAKLDEVFRQSEQYGVYHKLTVFHKNDSILNSFRPDGSLVTTSTEWEANYPKYFFSDTGQPMRWLEEAYDRYFIARWSYSPAIHSLEIANEIDYNSWSTNAALALAHFFNINSARKILMTTSFFGYWGGEYFYNNANIDYADKHWYADHRTANCYTNPDSCEPVSSLWRDSAENVRFCTTKFNDYANWYGGLNKPIVRGETGVWSSGVNDQDPAIAAETTGTYYHKKVWAHVGLLGFTCDGEWYPRFWETLAANQFPNDTYNTFKIYKAYDNFNAGEALNNGTHVGIGTDLGGNNQINIATSSGLMSAWGSKDTVSGKVLLWINNANQTWTNISAPVAQATLTIKNLPQGSYQAEWWDTRAGTVYSSPPYPTSFTVGSNGNLSFTVSNLSSDIAVKFINQNPPTPSPSCPLKSLGDTDCNNIINTLDFTDLISHFGSSDSNADLDVSGKVNLLDLSILLHNFGRTQ